MAQGGLPPTRRNPCHDPSSRAFHGGSGGFLLVVLVLQGLNVPARVREQATAEFRRCLASDAHLGAGCSSALEVPARHRCHVVAGSAPSRVLHDAAESVCCKLCARGWEGSCDRSVSQNVQIFQLSGPVLGQSLHDFERNHQRHDMCSFAQR